MKYDQVISIYSKCMKIFIGLFDKFPLRHYNFVP